MDQGKPCANDVKTNTHTGNHDVEDGTGWTFGVTSIEEGRSVSVLMRERQTKDLAAKDRS